MGVLKALGNIISLGFLKKQEEARKRGMEVCYVCQKECHPSQIKRDLCPKCQGEAK